jgi:hypothetical protein
VHSCTVAGGGRQVDVSRETPVANGDLRLLVDFDRLLPVPFHQIMKPIARTVASDDMGRRSLGVRRSAGGSRRVEPADRRACAHIKRPTPGRTTNTDTDTGPHGRQTTDRANGRPAMIGRVSGRSAHLPLGGPGRTEPDEPEPQHRRPSRMRSHQTTDARPTTGPYGTR